MIDAFLQSLGIAAQRYEHVAVFTVEESSKLPPMPGVGTKNLLLRDGKDARHFLVVVPHEKRVDLKALRTLLGADKLSFASPEQLRQYLGVEPGSATILGLVFDTQKHLEVCIDEDVWNAALVQCHPLVNTATIILPHDGLLAVLRATGHEARVLRVPERTE